MEQDLAAGYSVGFRVLVDYFFCLVAEGFSCHIQVQYRRLALKVSVIVVYEAPSNGFVGRHYLLGVAVEITLLHNKHRRIDTRDDY